MTSSSTAVRHSSHPYGVSLFATPRTNHDRRSPSGKPTRSSTTTAATSTASKPTSSLRSEQARSPSVGGRASAAAASPAAAKSASPQEEEEVAHIIDPSPSDRPKEMPTRSSQDSRKESQATEQSNNMEAKGTDDERPATSSADRPPPEDLKKSPISPSLKRTHSDLVDVAQGISITIQDPRGASSSKIPRLDGEESRSRSHSRYASASPPPDSYQQAKSPAHRRNPSDEEARQRGEAPSFRSYSWRPSAPAPGGSSGSLMSINSLSSPASRHAVPVSPYEGSRSDLPPPPYASRTRRESRSGRGDSRLPGFATLSNRGVSPPPPTQVARVNAQRAYVASSGPLASSGESSAGRSLGQFQPPPPPASASQYQVNPPPGGPSHQQMGLSAGYHSSNQQSALHHHAHHASGGYAQPYLPLSAGSPGLAHQAMQGCPPIHPSLLGLPGSGTGPGNKQQPSFVAKLYSMLEDEATGTMITWGPGGDAFSVANPAEFSRVILPSWFKHANWQSFVRQLNMYGFHKVNHTFSGAPNEEVQIWEFKHPAFRRGEVHLLGDIKRKSSRHKRTESQSQSFGGSIHGEGYGGPRSRSSTPMEMYPEPGMLQPPHGAMGGGLPPSSSDSRLVRGYEGSYRDHHPDASLHRRDRSDPMLRGGPRGYGGEILPPTAPGPSSLPIAGGRGHLKSSSISMAGPPASPAQHGPPAPGMEQEGYPKMSRVEDLSDRIDAIIRHSNYLESQVRTLSEDLYTSQQQEVGGKVHLLRILNRLTNVCTLSNNSSANLNDSIDGAEGGEERLRRQMLEVCQAEIEQLSGFLGLDQGTLSPPVPHRTLATARLPRRESGASQAQPPPPHHHHQRSQGQQPARSSQQQPYPSSYPQQHPHASPSGSYRSYPPAAASQQGPPVHSSAEGYRSHPSSLEAGPPPAHYTGYSRGGPPPQQQQQRQHRMSPPPNRSPRDGQPHRNSPMPPPLAGSGGGVAPPSAAENAGEGYTFPRR